MEQVYLSRRNLLTLLNKLDRVAAGGTSSCTLIKRDTRNPLYPQSCTAIAVTAVEDDAYYTNRPAGAVHPADLPKEK